MKFQTLLFALVACILSSASLAAPLTRCGGLVVTNDNYLEVTVGTPLTLSWEGNDGAVSIALKEGDVGNLEAVGVVASNFWESSTSFTPSTPGTYALSITNASGSTNYSPLLYVSPAFSRRSIIMDTALYLPRLFARGVTSLLPRAAKKKQEPPAVDFDGTPCWAVLTGLPDICLDSKGAMYKSRAAQLIEVDSVRFHNLQHGPVTSYKPSQIDARKLNDEPLAKGPDGTPCWAILGEIPDICLSPKGEVYHYAKDQAKELAALWTERYNSLQHGPIKGTKEYIEEEKAREGKEGKSIKARAWGA